ncbi:CTB family bacteriocin [Anabaena sp. CS-542/02]|uniref:CTB family bacteriocin n=1 Tax=Anabaena sp. CS-542/02 TaxID=3021719 RepID=UPI00232D7469|nr:CTB family bacteriocin [Anabaena sp. CS-542/02]MDB9445758.1 CTB family bacteriocin [Anabaena sp. CS-542/02]
MSNKITQPNLFEDLSVEQQELLAGGQSEEQMNQFDTQFPEEDSFDERPRKRVRRIPIRLTGILEVVK